MLGELPKKSCGGRCIIAGYGDVGKEAARWFMRYDIPFTIVDLKEYENVDQIIGDATDSEVLKKTEISCASTIIVSLNDDEKNMLTTILARNLNPHIKIISRANSNESISKLYRAGADYVTSLSSTCASILAKIIEKGGYDETSLFQDNIVITKLDIAGSKLENFTIGEADLNNRTGCYVLGLIKDNKFIREPEYDKKLTYDTVLVVLGTLNQMDKCSRTYDLNRVP